MPPDFAFVAPYAADDAPGCPVSSGSHPAVDDAVRPLTLGADARSLIRPALTPPSRGGVVALGPQGHRGWTRNWPGLLQP